MRRRRGPLRGRVHSGMVEERDFDLCQMAMSTAQKLTHRLHRSQQRLHWSGERQIRPDTPRVERRPQRKRCSSSLAEFRIPQRVCSSIWPRIEGLVPGCCPCSCSDQCLSPPPTHSPRFHACRVRSGRAHRGCCPPFARFPWKWRFRRYRDPNSNPRCFELPVRRKVLQAAVPPPKRTRCRNRPALLRLHGVVGRVL